MTVVERASRAAVYIKTEWKASGEVIPASGSGFFVSPQGHVLTNYHVVASRADDAGPAGRGDTMLRTGPLLIVVNSGTPTERQLEGTVLDSDKEIDLALLRTSFRPAHWLEMAGSDTVTFMQPLWVAGFPLGDTLALNKGNPEVTVSAVRVSALRNDASRTLTAFQLEGSVNPGNSGGPVVDLDGRLLGVVRAGVPGNTGTALAIPPAVVRRFLDSNRFALACEPKGLASDSTEVRLVATPRLASIEGLTMAVSLANGEDSGQVEVAREKDGRIEVNFLLRANAIRAAGPKGLSFLAVLRTAEGQEAATLSLTVPVASRRTSLTPPPAQAAASATGRSATSPTSRELAADESHSQNRLGRLASQVKLRPGASGVSVTNADVEAWDYVPVESSFALLTPAERTVAQKLEAAIMTCQAASRETMRLSREGAIWSSCELLLRTPEPTPNPWSYDSYSREHRTKCKLLRSAMKRQEACASIETLQAAAAKARVCQTPDGVWHQRDRALGTGCQIPRRTDE